jgi:hypothetical protein
MFRSWVETQECGKVWGWMLDFLAPIVAEPFHILLSPELFPMIFSNQLVSWPIQVNLSLHPTSYKKSNNENKWSITRIPFLPLYFRLHESHFFLFTIYIYIYIYKEEEMGFVESIFDYIYIYIIIILFALNIFTRG